MTVSTPNSPVLGPLRVRSRTAGENSGHEQPGAGAQRRIASRLVIGQLGPNEIQPAVDGVVEGASNGGIG